MLDENEINNYLNIYLIYSYTKYINLFLKFYIIKVQDVLLVLLIQIIGKKRKKSNFNLKFSKTGLSTRSNAVTLI